MAWYKIRTYLAHTGTGRQKIDFSLYIFAENINKAMKKYKSIRGIKRGGIPLKLEELSEEESNELERKIRRNSRLSLKKIKERGIYRIPTKSFSDSYFKRG